VPAPEQAPLAGAVGLGAGIAVVGLERARLFPALKEGVRAAARPMWFFGSAKARDALVLSWVFAVSLGLTLVLHRSGATLASTPRTLAFGLCATGLALAIGAYVAAVRGHLPPPARLPPGAAGPGRIDFDVSLFFGVTLAGIAHAFGVWPGVSRVGAALAVLLGIGVRPARAVEISLLATVPFWWADFASAVPDLTPFGRANAVIAALIGFVATCGAVLVLRALVARRRFAVLSIWMIPLACALFVYGRARGPSEGGGGMRISEAGALPITAAQRPAAARSLPVTAARSLPITAEDATDQDRPGPLLPSATTTPPR
jgi:undecaprenyl-diphosphatase